jgi:CubicO group peptidase (beta-lactamase class C family)
MNKTKAIAAQSVFFIALSLFGAVSLSAQNGPPVASKLDEYLNAATKQGFIGSVLVARDGKVIFSKGYGMANIEWDIPNTPQTIFRLGSITKQFTAASILLLQERGKLSVQDPIRRWGALLDRRGFVRVERSAILRQAALGKIARSDDDRGQEQLRLRPVS